MTFYRWLNAIAYSAAALLIVMTIVEWARMHLLAAIGAWCLAACCAAIGYVQKELE